jgi:hypothetical protein
MRVVCPLAKRVAGWALGKLEEAMRRLGKEEEEWQVWVRAPLSGTEMVKIVKGLYRLQLACCLWGYGGCAEESVLGWALREGLGVGELVATLEPWEMEQLGCVYGFVREVYEGLIVTIREDVQPPNPRLWGHAGGAEGAFDPFNLRECAQCGRRWQLDTRQD